MKMRPKCILHRLWQCWQALNTFKLPLKGLSEFFFVIPSQSLSQRLPYTFFLKGAPARESHTGTRLVSPAGGCEKIKVTPPELGSNLDFTIIECARVYQNVAYII